MKKPAQQHKHRTKKIAYPRGFFQSPFFHGLVALLPVMAMMMVLGLETGLFRVPFQRKIFISLGKGLDSPSLLYEASKEAIKEKDIEMGRRFYLLAQQKGLDNNVLGASTETEEELWPERKWEREWNVISPLLKESPSSFVFTRAAIVKDNLNEKDLARNYAKKAVELDPNNIEIRKELTEQGLLD